MPTVIMDAIVRFLAPQDIINLSMTCTFMQEICNNPRFWRKLNLKVTTLLLDKYRWESITKKFSEKGLIDFRLHYPRNEEGVKNLNFTEANIWATKILTYLPVVIENLQVPIFMFTNVLQLLPTFQTFSNLKVLQMGNHIQDFGEFKNWKRKNDSIKSMLTILFTKVQKLESVVIHDCHGFLEKPLSSLTENNRQLRFLDVSYCWSLRRSGLLKISHFVNLETLKLCCCGINDEDMQIVLSSNLDLKDLDVSWTFVTNSTLLNVPKKLPNLLNLDIIGCAGITYSGLRQLYFDVRGIKNIYIRKAFNGNFYYHSHYKGVKLGRNIY